MLNTIESVAKALKNITARLSRGGADSPVYAVNEQTPDDQGKVDLSYMARQDKTNVFTESQAFWGGFNGGNIPDGGDLDNVIPGMWKCLSNVTAATLKNSPFGKNSFYLICMGASDGYLIQNAYHYSGAEMATRRRNPDTPDELWSEWIVVSYDQHMNNGVVADGADIEKYMTAGRYAINGTGVVNGPFEGNAYAMFEVDTLAGIVRQTITTMHGSVFINVYSGNPAAWQGWKKVTTAVA